MTSLERGADAAGSVPGLSDEETVGFIPAPGPKAALFGGKVRKAALAVGLLLAAGVAVALLRPAADCKAQGRGADLSSAVGLAERPQSVEEHAHAIVQVLNQKPREEMDGLVQKAMKRAGEKALEKRRLQNQAGFNQILAEQSDQCTIVSPRQTNGEGIFLAHDLSTGILMSLLESGHAQWKITLANGQNEYELRAVIPGLGGETNLVHNGQNVALGPQAQGNSDRWRIRPAVAGPNPDGLFVIEAIPTGPPGPRRFLTRQGQTGVVIQGANTALARWRIPCIRTQYARQDQRKAICAFNIIYATQYVARSSLMVQAAARTCPNSKGLLNKICALNGLVTVASFANLALAISDAASSCAASTSVRALCASAVSALVVSLTTVGAGGIVVAATCKPGLQPADLGLPAGATPANLQGVADIPARRLFLGGGTANFLGQCVLDFTQVAWSLGSVGLAITAAVRDSCPESLQGTGILVGLSQSACSMDIAAVIYAFGRIALFLALSTVHCTNELNLQALCAGGVSALVAAAAALIVTGDAFYIACDQGINVINAGGTVPLRIGAAAEAGATRRLAAQSLADGAKHADVHEMVRDLGFNVSDPLKLPTFDSIDSAMKVIEAYDSREASRYGADEETLRRKYKSVEQMWESVGFNASVIPEAPAGRSEHERFVSLMEPVLSEEDKAKVSAALAPSFAQKWQRPTAKRCA